MQINKKEDGKETVDIGGVAKSRSQRCGMLSNGGLCFKEGEKLFI